MKFCTRDGTKLQQPLEQAYQYKNIVLSTHLTLFYDMILILENICVILYDFLQ